MALAEPGATDQDLGELIVSIADAGKAQAKWADHLHMIAGTADRI